MGSVLVMCESVNPKVLVKQSTPGGDCRQKRDSRSLDHVARKPSLIEAVAAGYRVRSARR
jgi:hypothetical protein